MSELYKLKKAPAESPKKWQVKVRTPSGGVKTVQFGARGYEDYTQHKDKSRRDNYRSRHRHDKINDPTKAGFWSWHVLWGDSTSLQKNLSSVKRKYRLNPAPEESMAERKKTANAVVEEISGEELQQIRSNYYNRAHHDPEPNPSDDYAHWGPEEYEQTARFDDVLEEPEYPPSYESDYDVRVRRRARRYIGQVWDGDELLAETSPYADQEEAFRQAYWLDYWRALGYVRNNPGWARKMGRGMAQAEDYARESFRDLREGYRQARRQNPRLPRSTEVQSLIFDKDFFDKREAKSWARTHDFLSTGVDETENSYRIRQANPSDFAAGTFRTIELTEGVKAVIAMPKRGVGR